MTEPRMPVFPLNTVLFPGGPLPLRIFEPRYLDMVSSCLRNATPFAVCCIKSGREVGDAPEIHAVGTAARIVDWHQYDDGILGVTAIGEYRLRVIEYTVQADKLMVGHVRALPPEPSLSLPANFTRMADLLKGLIDRTAPLFEQVNCDFDDATWVGSRLTEILPVPLTQKQHLLELEDPFLRLETVDTMLQHIAESE